MIPALTTTGEEVLIVYYTDVLKPARFARSDTDPGDHDAPIPVITIAWRMQLDTAPDASTSA